MLQLSLEAGVDSGVGKLLVPFLPSSYSFNILVDALCLTPEVLGLRSTADSL